MFTSYRTYEEQIRKIAQSLKAPFQGEKDEFGRCETPGTVRTQIKQLESAGTTPMQRQQFRSQDSKITAMAPNCNPVKLQGVHEKSTCSLDLSNLPTKTQRSETEIQVLLVDDDDTLLNVGKSYLEKIRGFSV